MKKLEILKTGISTVASIGVGLIVGNAVKATTPEDIRTITKVLIGVGSAVLTGVASNMTSNYTEDKIDEAAEAIQDAFKNNEEE